MEWDGNGTVKAMPCEDAAECYLNRLKSFKSSLFKIFKQEHKQSLTMDQVRRQVDADHPGVEFSDAELWAALDSMQDDNQVMVSENVVFLI